MRDDHSASADPSLPRKKLPDFSPPTPEEIERRRALAAEVRALREEIGPIGVRADELLRQVRAEADGLGEQWPRPTTGATNMTRHDRPAPSDATLLRIKLPPFKPITPEELERRRALFARVIERRERIGPIGVPADDLVHAVRIEADGIDE